MILPVSTDAFITSECWTYYKIAILQSSPNFIPWTINNLKLFTNASGDSHFGVNGERYSLSHFESCFNIYDGDILNVPEDRIIPYLINKIQNGFYVILDLNYYKLYDENRTEFRLHESLLYGFDCAKNVFTMPLLYNGKFIESEISFSSIQKGYHDAYEYYTKNKLRLFYRRSWFYGITLIKIKNNPTSQNSNYDLLNRLQYEATGYEFIKKNTENKKVHSHKFATGTTCMKYLSDRINLYCTNREDALPDLSHTLSSLLKIYENHRIIYEMICWSTSQFKSNDELNHLIHEYLDCCNVAKRVYFLGEKYRTTSNISDLSTIASLYKKLYKNEKTILKKIVAQFQDLYISSFISLPDNTI